MRLNHLKPVCFLFVSFLFIHNVNAQELYKNAKAPVQKRVDDLLKRMTLKEKIMQLNQYTEGDNDNPNNIEKSVNELSPEIGSLIFSSSDPVFRNKIQKKAVEESRLGIPILFAFDVIHGYKTIYPIPLGQAASWNLELAKKASAIAAKESRLGGIEWTFSPMIDVAYDPRWGRVSEGYGEDPYTNAQFGVSLRIRIPPLIRVRMPPLISLKKQIFYTFFSLFTSVFSVLFGRPLLVFSVVSSSYISDSSNRFFIR